MVAGRVGLSCTRGSPCRILLPHGTLATVAERPRACTPNSDRKRLSVQRVNLDIDRARCVCGGSQQRRREHVLELVWRYAQVGCGPADRRSCYSWYSEESDFVADGHFIQVVWKLSTQVGCAVVTGCTNYQPPGIPDGLVNAVVVCRYLTPGNFNNDYLNQVGNVTSNTQCTSPHATC